MNEENLIRDALALPISAIAYTVDQRLRQLFPEHAVIQGDDSTFSLDTYAQDGFCTAHQRPEVHLQVETTWDGEQPEQETANGWYHVEWESHQLEVVVMKWQQGFCRSNHFWIVAPTEEVALGFFRSVCQWCSEVRGEVLVFAGGDWVKDSDLYQELQGATFDNLILAGDLKRQIRSDLESFFASRSTYEQYGVPWKRGVLLIGPPGNGKTHAVKALINSLQRPCLYVKSFTSQHSTDHDNIRAVFKRARETSPCFLVLEDLDSLVDDDNRSFFLNELDGFASNTGIVTLATTNHPDRLDPAILERPSRFDRKYHFDLPEPAERAAYLAMWNERLQEAMRLDEDGLDQLVGMTESFSFAYLKELMLSSIMRWIQHAVPGSMAAVSAAQVDALREQMASAPDDTPAPEPAGMDYAMMRRMQGGRFRRRMGG